MLELKCLGLNSEIYAKNFIIHRTRRVLSLYSAIVKCIKDIWNVK